VTTSVFDRRYQPARPFRRTEPVPSSRNWVVVWVVTVALLVIAISLVILRGERVEEETPPSQYPGVVSAEDVGTP